MKSFISKEYNYAIVGATNNRDKYGNIVFRNLLEKGYNVIPVNINDSTVENILAYSQLSDIPEKIDVVVFIVPPNVALKVLSEQVKKLGINKVWFQPGSENKQIIEFCKLNDIKCISKKCIMTETGGF